MTIAVLAGCWLALTATVAQAQPAPPVLSSPASGTTFRDGRIHVVGTAAPNAHVTFYNGYASEFLADGDADATGHFDLSFRVVPGAYYLVWTQRVDGEGESDRYAIPGTVLVVVYPGAPTLAVVGGTTRMIDAPVTVGGLADPGSTVEVRRNNTVVDTVAVTDEGTWSADIDLVSDDNFIEAYAIAPNTMRSAVSNVVHVSGLDRPVVTAPAEGDAVSPAFSLTGTGVHGATVTVQEGDTVLGSAVVGSSTGYFRWTVPVTGLAAGTRTLTVTQTLNGVTTPGVTRTVQVPPPAPTMTAPTAGTTVAVDEPVRFTGVASPGATVEVHRAGESEVLGSGEADGDGAFDFTSPLPPGTYAVALTQRIGSGIAGAQTDGVQLSVPAAPPTIVLETTAPIREGDDITVSGVAWPGAYVAAYDNGGWQSAMYAGSDGSWRLTFPAQRGDNEIRAYQSANGAQSDWSPFVHVTAAAAVDLPVVTSPTEGQGWANPVHFTGTGRPGATIEVLDAYNGNELLASGTVGGDGRFDFTATLPLTGPISSWLLGFRQTVGERSSDQTDYITVGMLKRPVTMTVPATRVLAGTPVTVSGTALPGATIRLYDGETQVGGTVTANRPAGTWSQTFTPTAGVHRLFATQRSSGVLGQRTEGPTVTGASGEIRPATGVSATGATLHAVVASSVTDAQFLYRKAGGTADAVVTGLDPSSTYYAKLRPYPMVSGAYAYSDTVSFTTSAGAPAAGDVVVDPVVDLTTTGATLGVTVDTHGSPVSGVVEWGTSAGDYARSAALYASGSSGARVLSRNLATQFAPGTTYHYRVTVTNAGGTFTTEDQSFATLSLAPEVTIGAVDPLTTTTATINTVVDTHGAAVTSTLVQLGTTTAYTKAPAPLLSGALTTGGRIYTRPFANLKPGTTYHYKVTVTTTAGTYESTDQTFTTAAGT